MDESKLYPVPEVVPDHMAGYRTMADIVFPIPAHVGNGPVLELHMHGMGGVAIGAEGTGSWIIQVWQRGVYGLDLLYSEANDTTTPMGETHIQAAVSWATYVAELANPEEPWAAQLGEWVEQFCVEPKA